MTVKLLTPRMGEGVEEVTVMQWLKHEGDPVRELEPLVEVETDKVVTEIPSPADGTLLKINIPQGAVAHVGEALAEIGALGEMITAAPAESAPSPAAVPSAPSPVVPSMVATDAHPGAARGVAVGAHPSEASGPSPAPTSPTAETWISPLVRKMAAEHNLDVTRIPGSGLGGRVTKQDVLDYLEHPAPAATQTPAAPAFEITSGEVLPVSPVRRQIAERMVQSVHTSPHVLTVMEADLSRVLAHQAANREQFTAEGIRLTLTAYFISAIASALRAHPLVNASWTDSGILLHQQINIGMAVSLGDAGLIVPVIRGADGLSLVGLARTINDLADRARSKHLTPEDVKGGTFTLTNHGTGGSLFALPIINQPQVGILGTGSLQKRPVVVTDPDGRDSIAIRPMIYLSFVFDHRILDGASADAFLVDVKRGLESYS